MGLINSRMNPLGSGDHAILDFLDGALPPDEEAELMHRLSVSPERRAMLRSYMNQKSFFAEDRQAIQVPYAAEQGLWHRLGAVLPMGAIEETAAPLAVQSDGQSALTALGSHSVPLLSRVFTGVGASVAASVVTLMLGLGAGYFLGNSGTTVVLDQRALKEPAFGAANTTQSLSAIGNATNAAHSPEMAPTSPRRIALAGNSGILASRTQHPQSVAAVASSVTLSPSADIALSPSAEIASNPSNADITPNASQLTTQQTQIPNGGSNTESDAFTTPAAPSADLAGLSPVAMRSERTASPRAIGGDDGIKPIFLHSYAGHTIDKTLLQRFEFSFTESFGRQYPNSVATNTSMPLITNSAIGVFFQVLPHSNALWAGIDAGTANITKKNIFTQAGNQLDHLQEVVTSDTVHAQTGYFAAFLQYRVQAFANTDLMFTGGYGMASLGKMMIGELGLHYDVSREVGIQIGLRASRFTYDLTADKERAIQSGSGSLVVPRGVEDASPSFNVEMNTGLFFHF